MKAIYILKIVTDEGVGYFDGNFNWHESLTQAKQFDGYVAAEEFLEKMFAESCSGGFIQIEKYFIYD